jgi:hypothetical protein
MKKKKTITKITTKQEPCLCTIPGPLPPPLQPPPLPKDDNDGAEGVDWRTDGDREGKDLTLGTGTSIRGGREIRAKCRTGSDLSA